MQKIINTLDLLNNLTWQQRVLEIRGEAPHRLHNILLLKLNASGRYDNRIPCDPKEISKLMGYKSTQQLKTARKALVRLGLWAYHESNEYNHSGRMQGYFSVPSRFLEPKDLQGTILVPSKDTTESKGQSLQGTISVPSKDLQGTILVPSKDTTESKGQSLQGTISVPTQGTISVPYIYREIDRYIDDDDIANILKIYVDRGLPYLYTGETLQKQLATISLLCKHVGRSKALEIARIVGDTRVTKDVLNYLIQSLRSVDAPKPCKKPIYGSHKKHLEEGTDWSKKKAEVDESVNAEELKKFFKDFENQNGMK